MKPTPLHGVVIAFRKKEKEQEINSKAHFEGLNPSNGNKASTYHGTSGNYYQTDTVAVERTCTSALWADLN
jgi:hypothetical protein